MHRFQLKKRNLDSVPRPPPPIPSTLFCRGDLVLFYSSNPHPFLVLVGTDVRFHSGRNSSLRRLGYGLMDVCLAEIGFLMCLRTVRSPTFIADGTFQSIRMRWLGDAGLECVMKEKVRTTPVRTWMENNWRFGYMVVYSFK